VDDVVRSCMDSGVRSCREGGVVDSEGAAITAHVCSISILRVAGEEWHRVGCCILPSSARSDPRGYAWIA
jgi:hypothetical protein